VELFSEDRFFGTVFVLEIFDQVFCADLSIVTPIKQQCPYDLKIYLINYQEFF
jgi:hypothetical protein